ncbi:GAF domain-containing protein, partial [bacterium CPR1]|nr:GAF domain-containing protein [bacterium CPR1]
LLRDEQKRALELYQESCRRLKTWAEGLSRLVEGARAASSTLDSRAILDVLVERALESAPCPSLALFLGEELLRARPPELALSFAERMRPQLGPARKSGRPLALDGRWQPLQDGEESLLLVPLMAESGAVGVLCLGRTEKEAFPRHQQDLLSMLACHAALALDNARHFQDLSDALRRVQESEVQLVQSSKLAAVGQLAAGVAHELNTPLNSILLAAETASELVESSPERARKHLELTVRSGLRARDIVAKLLYYARDAREGKVEADLNQVVRDTLELHGHQLRLSGLEVECELAELPRISMCPNEIQQVLVNLLLNARDVLPAGGKVWVRTRRQDSWLELEVEDSGPGVPKEAAEKIFDPFFTTKPIGQGTGLGLSVSRQILERHGGTLRLEESRRGARFVLALPAPA